MGKVISRINLFKACRSPPEDSAKEEKKEESKRPVYKAPRALHNKKPSQTPLEISSSDVLLDDDMQSFTQIGFRNDDGYFSLEELEYYRKLYAKEKINYKPLTNIKWQYGKVLGTGSFGTVIYGFDTETGKVMAVKQVLLSEFRNANMIEKIKALEQEIEILSKLQHKNIVRYIGTTRDDKYFNIFLEYEAGGSIAELLRKYGVFKEPLIRIYTKQILEGLEYLHAHDVVHRDIKGANVLVDSNGVCKLADFGGAKKIYNAANKEQYMSLRGTPYWMAPEVIKQTGHGRKADIWSVGCTVIEMATGKPPWSQYKNQFTALYYIGHAVDPPPYPAELSPTAHAFLNLVFQRNPRKRANVCKLLKHPFITGENTIDLTASHKLLSPDERAHIFKQASNVKPESDIGSITSPKNVNPAIEIEDSSLEDSEYNTNGQNQKVHFYIVSKANDERERIAKQKKLPKRPVNGA